MANTHASKIAVKQSVFAGMLFIGASLMLFIPLPATSQSSNMRCNENALTSVYDDFGNILKPGIVSDTAVIALRQCEANLMKARNYDFGSGFMELDLASTSIDQIEPW